MVLVLVGSLALGATMIGESLPTGGLLAAAPDLAAFAVAIGGYGALFSLLERARPTGGAWAGLTTSIRFTP